MQVGLFRGATVTTQPDGARNFLESKVTTNTAVDATIATQLFTDYAPETIALQGVSFTEGGWTAFCEQVATSMSVTSLSFEGLSLPLADTPGKSCDFSDLISALAENSSVARLDLVGCGVDLALAKSFVVNVIPWNKSITTWNFNGNPLLGAAADDDGGSGVQELVKAFHDTHSAVQCLSLQGCGIAEAPLLRDDIIGPLMELTGIVSADFNGNAAFTDAQVKSKLAELDEVMKQNFQFLGNGSEVMDYKPLSTVMPPALLAVPEEEERKKEEEEKKKVAPTTATTTTPSTARKPRISMIGKQPPQQSGGGGGAGSGSPLPQQRARGQSTLQQQPPARANSMPPRKRADSKKAEETPKQEEATADSSSHNHNTPARGRSPAPATPQRSRSGYQASPARNTPSVRQQSIDQGTDHWREVKNQYNQYIRSDSPNRVLQTINRDVPKFVLGKRVETIKNSGASPSFKGGYARTAERAPTPSEIRKLAPWNQKEGAETPPNIPVGGVHRARTPDGKVLRFVNGGDISCISDDPRDVGYLARRVKSGMVKPKPSLFMSNSARELRWGTTEGKGVFLPRQAQAPPVGAYKMRDEWEERAKKLRESSRNTSATGRPCFGGSALPRASARPTVKSDGPAPGSYEIP